MGLPHLLPLSMVDVLQSITRVESVWIYRVQWQVSSEPEDVKDREYNILHDRHADDVNIIL